MSVIHRIVRPALLFAFAAAAVAGCAERTRHSPPSQQGVVIAALGDSITAGSPIWDPDPQVRAQIGANLNELSQYEYWAAQRLHVSFRNCGIFGQRTDQIALRLDECARGARYLIVQGGINDIAQGRSVLDAARDLEAMVRRGQELGLSVQLVQVLPWNNGYPRAVGPIKQLNNLIAQIGARSRVPVRAFYHALEDPQAPGRMRADLTIDGNHPSVAGYRILGGLIGLSPASSGHR